MKEKETDCCCDFNPDDESYQELVRVSCCCTVHNMYPIECQAMEICECRKDEE